MMENSRVGLGPRMWVVLPLAAFLDLALTVGCPLLSEYESVHISSSRQEEGRRVVLGRDLADRV